MKNLLFIIISIVLAFSVNAQTIMLQNSNTGVRKSNDQFTGFQATFSYDKIDAITIAGTEKGTFSALTIAEAFQAVGNYGFPELPEFRKMIQIPVGATPTVKIKNFTTTEINLGEYGIYPVFPIQPSVRKDQTEIPFIYDEKTYGIDDYIYSDVADVKILGTMRGLILGMVTVRPIQYNPVSHSILAFNNIEIEVSFDNADKTKTEELFVNTFSPYFTKTYDIVYNKGVTKDVYDDHPDLYKTPVHMLVIANRMFETTLQPWIEWKTKKGFYMDVNYTDVIGTTAAQIKTFCHNKYNQGVSNGTAPTFVIFVGDVAQVPASQIGTYTSKATDLYYARTTTNGFFPDMYYSRMSAQNPQALANQIEKILYYEKYQFADPTYLDNVLLIAGVDGTWNPRVGQPTINYATNYYFNAAHGYANIHKYLTSYTGCYANFNNVGFANYTAHCGEDNWNDPYFSSSQINTLTNLNKYFVAMGNCCLAADFGWSGNGGICFGEQMMIAEKKGAVGYIGSSPSSYWGEDFHFAVGAYAGSITTITNPTMENTKTGCYDFMFRDADFNTLCSHVFGGNLSVQYAHDNPGYTTHISAPYYWEAYNVLGDGSLMPYNAQAALNNVAHLPVIYIGLPTYEVLADPGSYVAISKDGVLLGVAVADASGVALVNIIPITSGGDVDIVVTRNQRQPYMVQVPAVAQEGPYIVPAGYTVIGDEKLTYISTNTEIEVTLKNVGIATTIGTTNVTIACDDPQITFNTSTATCPAIAPDGTATVKFKVTIANNIVDAKIFLTNLTITDGTKQTWEGKMSLKAYAPKFSLAKVLVNGMENGSLPKGSLSKITVVVDNKGGADAYSVVGSIEINNEYVYLACDEEKTSSGQDLPAGESMDFNFYVITSPNMPSGYEATINFMLTAMYGRTYGSSFKVSNSGSDNYCVPGATNCDSYNDRITSLILVKNSDQSILINNPNPICNTGGYTDYTNVMVEFEPGATYTIKVKTGYQGHRVRGWIDLNGNNTFDENEVMFTVECVSAGVEYSKVFSIPQDFVPGDQRFRIRTRDGSNIPGPCESYSWGQTLDYTAVFPELYPRVQNVVAELQNKNIYITWEAPAEGTPIGYNIYRDGNKLNSTLLTDLSFTETEVEQGVYAYNIKAVYNDDKESFAEMSNVICYFIVCNPPKNFEGTDEGTTAVLKWQEPDNMESELTGYKIFKGTEEILVAADVNEYRDENLVSNIYKYQIAAVYKDCESDKTDEVEITICEIPVILSVIAEENSIMITWSKPAGEVTGYYIFRDEEKLNQNLITVTEYKDENLEPGTYIYKVAAVYEHCTSDNSAGEEIILGIHDYNTGSFSIYPNPTTGEFTITNYELQITNVEVFDIYGRKQNVQFTSYGLAVLRSYGLTHLPAGIYFVKIYADNNIAVTKRLVIIK